MCSDFFKSGHGSSELILIFANVAECEMFMWPEVEHPERDYFSEFLQNRFVRHSGEVVFEPADLSDPPVRLFLRFVLGGEEVLPVVFGRDVELLRKNLGNICHIAMRSIPFDGLRLAGETGDLRTQSNLKLNLGDMGTYDTVTYWGDRDNLARYAGYALYDKANITDEANFREDLADAMSRFNNFIEFIRWFDQNEGAFFSLPEAEILEAISRLEFLLGSTDWHNVIKDVATEFDELGQYSIKIPPEDRLGKVMELLKEFANVANPDLPRDLTALIRTQQVIVIV